MCICRGEACEMTSLKLVIRTPLKIPLIKWDFYYIKLSHNYKETVMYLKMNILMRENS